MLALLNALMAGYCLGRLTAIAREAKTLRTPDALAQNAELQKRFGITIQLRAGAKVEAWLFAVLCLANAYYALTLASPA